MLARVQYEENRPAHLVLHTRDKQLKSAPHAGHQSMCCHICSGSTVSKGPEDRPKKISHWPQCHSVDTRLFCCRCATSASKNVVTEIGQMCRDPQPLLSTAWLAAAGWHLTCLPTSQYCGDRDGRRNACVASHLNRVFPPMHMQEKIEENCS